MRLQTSCIQRLPKFSVYCKAIVLLLGGHWGSGVHPVVLHLVDGAIDKAPLSGGRVVGVEQHVEPRPAVAHQQPVHLRGRSFPRSQELNFCNTQPRMLGDCGLDEWIGIKIISCNLLTRVTPHLERVLYLQNYGWAASGSDTERNNEYNLADGEAEKCRRTFLS